MKKIRHIPKALIGFLIASFLIWVLINLSKEYSSVVTYKVDYNRLPQDKLLQETPLESLDLLLKGTGFKLLSAQLSNKKIQLQVDKLNQKKTTNFYLLPNSNRLAIQQQLPSGLKLEEILQDTIHLKIGNLSTKKIPVIANLDLQFLPGYDLSEKTIISPDSIVISGPELQLNKIKNITTNSVILEDINEDFSVETLLNMPNNLEHIRFNVDKVILVGKVDQFTEGTFELPFRIENAPIGVNLNTFPKTVKVTYKVGLKNFNKVVKNSFEIICDYAHTKENELPYLLPKIKAKSNLVSSIKIEPEKIEYLIQK